MYKKTVLKEFIPIRFWFWFDFHLLLVNWQFLIPFSLQLIFLSLLPNGPNHMWHIEDMILVHCYMNSGEVGKWLSVWLPEFLIDSLLFNLRQFVYPLPRGEGYEFFVQQWNGKGCHFTPLLSYQVLNNACWSSSFVGIKQCLLNFIISCHLFISLAHHLSALLVKRLWLFVVNYSIFKED